MFTGHTWYALLHACRTASRPRQQMMKPRIFRLEKAVFVVPKVDRGCPDGSLQSPGCLDEAEVGTAHPRFTPAEPTLGTING